MKINKEKILDFNKMMLKMESIYLMLKELVKEHIIEVYIQILIIER